MELFAYKNMVDYAKSTMETFDVKPFGEVDSMILSWISYYRFHEEKGMQSSPIGMRLADLNKAEYYKDMMVEVWSTEDSLNLLTALAASPRFRNLRMKYYRDERDEASGIQFAAMVFSGINGMSYVAYRGTDWSLVGWKEDFRMALKEPIPSQIRARDYLNYIAKRIVGGLIIGGHSKGGNLAVYAAATCDPKVRKRICAVYSHDGPGFLADVIRENPGFQEILPLVKKTVPQFSVFGMLLEQTSEFRIIKSRGTGVGEHNLMTWELEDNCLIEEKSLNQAAEMLNTRVNTWLSKIEDQDRAAFIDNLFDVVEETGARDIETLAGDPAKYVPQILKNAKDLDPETQKFMRHLLGMLAVL